MTEHESNLRDFYIGLAMLGLLIDGNKDHENVAHRSVQFADSVLKARSESDDEGIVAIKKRRNGTKAATE